MFRIAVTETCFRVEKAQAAHLVAPDTLCLFCPDASAPGPASASDPSPSDSPVHLDDEWDGSEDGILDFTSFVNQVSTLYVHKEPPAGEPDRLTSPRRRSSFRPSSRSSL